ncbi:hypothetical protein EYF80_021956 [Liparis tanakae]|uniref:Uncharacterized protein n=1 Tax=Liparis tanakae TaxID=230148 RepID=A0A4Z2HSJ9_9TELE|nr:hypothetical protein EYF80_021956 [Liparis tanakae]
MEMKGLVLVTFRTLSVIMETLRTITQFITTVVVTDITNIKYLQSQDDVRQPEALGGNPQLRADVPIQIRPGRLVPSEPGVTPLLRTEILRKRQLVSGVNHQAPEATGNGQTHRTELTREMRLVSVIFTSTRVMSPLLAMGRTFLL